MREVAILGNRVESKARRGFRQRRESRAAGVKAFEDITVAIEAGALLEVVLHQNPAKYPRQKVMVVEVADYAVLATFIEKEDPLFLKTIIPSLKTIIPSRKATCLAA